MVRTRRTATDSPMASAEDLERVEAARRAASRNSAEKEDQDQEHDPEPKPKPAAPKRVTKRKAAPKKKKAPVKRTTRTRQLAEEDEESDGEADSAENTPEAEAELGAKPSKAGKSIVDNHSPGSRPLTPPLEDDAPQEVYPISQARAPFGILSPGALVYENGNTAFTNASFQRSSVQVVVSSTGHLRSSHESASKKRPSHHAASSEAAAHISQDREHDRPLNSIIHDLFWRGYKGLVRVTIEPLECEAAPEWSIVNIDSLFELADRVNESCQQEADSCDDIQSSHDRPSTPPPQSPGQEPTSEKLHCEQQMRTPPQSPAAYSELSSDVEDADQTGSKRKRKDNIDESPAKRSRLVEPRSDQKRGGYYEEGDMVILLDKEKKDRKTETRKRGTTRRSAPTRKGASKAEKGDDGNIPEPPHLEYDQPMTDSTEAEKDHEGKADTPPWHEHDQQMADEEDALPGGSVRKEKDVAKADVSEHLPGDKAANEVTPSKPETPSRGSWSSKFSLSGIGGLFATPLNVFRRSAARESIPDFAQPKSESTTGETPAKADNVNNVARPLFSAQKPRKTPVKTPKKSTKAKRQEAIDHQNDLERRQSATTAVANATLSAEEIEAEIQRRVQAALEEMQEQSPKSAKRKRADGPGSTPHARKTSRSSLAESSLPVVRYDREKETEQEQSQAERNEPKTPPAKPMFEIPAPNSGRNASFGLDYDDEESGDDLESEMPPSKRVKTVSFAPRTESLTTPPHGSELAQKQARRPPNTDWRPGQMFRDGPLRSALKSTGYTPQWTPGPHPSSIDDAEAYENYTPHAIREGIPDHLFNFAGSFSLPADTFYDSDSDEEGEFEPLKADAGSTPMPKKMMDRPAAQISPTEEAPPAAPQPAHATLPSPAQSRRDSGSQPDALSAARAKATQFTPKQPSRLRESTNMPAAKGLAQGNSVAPLGAARVDQSRTPAPAQFQPLSDLIKENIDPEVLAELSKITSGAGSRKELEQAGIRPLRERFSAPDEIDREVLTQINDSFPQFWSTIGSTVKQQIKEGVESWKPAQSTGAGF